ncbi:hypothetical protein DQG23_02600 [Paenibacillus contaminans]|uniref:Yip1 domain-containing protein n=2 Tax=Paenibacillus contaminans TaxID=450362 RepID=A0A329MXL5_9BACL|nr:hypothetical protein DQG23_02600 [Paenibacillus contaminans]
MKGGMEMRRYFFKLLVILLISFAVAASSALPAYAALPYRTSSTDYTGEGIPSPDAYKPLKTVKGFSGPEDLFITADDEIYVADTKNNRIVHLDAEGNVVRYIPSETGKVEDARKKAQLRGPEGVFVSKDGSIYVADTGNRRVAVFDSKATYQREYVSPPSQFIPANYLFVPSKVVIDPRGYLYIANKGGYQGLLQLTFEGEFAGFFGSNKVQADWIDRIKRKFYTEQQLAEEDKKLPGVISNMTIDERGFIYTINRNMARGQIKRLNAASYDLLGDINFAPWDNAMSKTNFLDIAVDSRGMITAIEEGSGFIDQYDSDGNVIFTFGGSGKEDRYGLLQRPTGLVVNSRGDLIIADGDLDILHWMVRTEFGELVHRAISLSSQGDYEEALPIWKHILRYNGTFERAYQGIAKAQFGNKQFAEAMDNFSIARDKDGYSEVFWEYRMIGMQRYFGSAMTVLLVAGAVLFVLRRYLKQRRKRLRQQGGTRSQTANDWFYSLQIIGRILRKPADTLYDIANSNRIKFAVPVAIVAASFIVNIAGKAVVSFIFSDVRFRDLNLMVEAGAFLGLWLVWVLANYLTGSVMQGEGTMKKVFAVNAYAMAPVLLFTLPLQLLSNALTLQELAFYDAAMRIMQLWMLVLMFIGTMMVHNYNLKESIRMSAVSLFSLVCISLFAFALGGLVYGAMDFFTQLGQELVKRG